MGKSTLRAALVAALLIATTEGHARAPAPLAQPAVLDNVLACLAVADTEARLACFDRNVGLLAEAAGKHDLMVADREQVRSARRSLFGFAVPDLKIFGFGSGDKTAEENELRTTIRSAERDRDGRWLLKLADGAAWRQTDDSQLFRDPKDGMSVRISRGALGNYWVHVDGQLGFKARRES